MRYNGLTMAKRQPTLREIQRIVTFDDLRNQHASVGYTMRKLDGLAEELIKDPENVQLVDHYDRLVNELGKRTKRWQSLVDDLQQLRG